MMDPELTVAFCCPPVLDDVAENNLGILKQNNPDIPVHVVKNDLSEDKEYGWHNADQAFFKWFLNNKPEGRRFALIESDMLCTISLREFYGSVWDAPVAAKRVLRPGVEWYWWREIGRLPEDLREFSTGAAPLAGILFSRDAMEQMSPVVLDIEDVFSELRVGTVAKYLDLKIVEAGWPSIKALPLNDGELGQPGLYHMVKHVFITGSS